MTHAGNTTLFTLYEEQYSKVPGAKHAVIFCDGNRCGQMTYKELEECAAGIASALSRVAPREVVACYCGPSVVTPAVLLGVLKVSSAFLAWDVDSKIDLHAIADYVPVRLLIVEEPALKVSGLKPCSCWALFSEVNVSSINLKVFRTSDECCCKQVDKCNLHKIDRECCKNLAYVVQTSGTTGGPKVVQVPHSCIVPNIIHLRSLYSLASSDVVFLASPMTFDPSIVDIFLALSSGASLLIVPNHVKKMPKIIGKILLDKAVTVLQVTPSFLLSFHDEFLKNSLLGKESAIRILSLGGEKCPSVKKLQSIQHTECRAKSFNLYGLTEVSCWAMYKEIDFSDQNSDVSLGLPLSDTEADIRNEHGQSIQEGSGQLFIGGPKRYCIVNSESEIESQQLRATGDWVYKKRDGELFYEGRKDDIIKYHGKKLCLSVLDKAIESLDFVASHLTYLRKNEPKLYIFIVLKVNCCYSESDAQTLISKSLQKCAESFPPLKIVFVPHIPVTHHGKADRKKLEQHILKGKRKAAQEKFLSETEVFSLVSSLWKELTLRPEILDSDNFILSGGNSISALQFISEVEQQMCLLCPSLLDVLLNSTFKDVLNLLMSVLNSTYISEVNNKPKKMHFDSSSDREVSERRTEGNDSKHQCEGRLCHAGATRRGYQESCFCGGCSFENCVRTLSSKSPKLQEEWRFDLGKCVDSSACAVYYPKLNSFHVYAGSHSGRFACANIREKKILWEAILPDRIESSACLCAGGCCVVVGCYDHYLYCFESLCGTLKWKVKAEAEIKSSPVVSDSNIAFVGCHDQHLYAVYVQTGVVAWKKKVSNGSIFSSPALSSKFVCVGTLDGVVAAVQLETGNLLWSYMHGKPFFSSPKVTDSSIFIGCVDGNLLQFDFYGNMIGRYSSEGAVFSSPAVVYSSDLEGCERIVFGSHSSNVYCFSASGALLWTYACDCPVYATPFVFTGGDRHIYIATGSTNGKLHILSAENGSEVCSFACPGQIFSSPVVINDYLVVGCRNNNVYIFRI